MKIETTSFPGVKLIRPDTYPDNRGSFQELFEVDKYKGLGLPTNFTQDNLSTNNPLSLRGMHFQANNPQGKLIQCVQGEILDVVVDVRLGSPTFGKSAAFVLNSEYNAQLWVPPGYAHGFQAFGDHTKVLYKCTGKYDPTDGYSLDPYGFDLGAVSWHNNAILSEKDRNGYKLNHLPDLPWGMKTVKQKRAVVFGAGGMLGKTLCEDLPKYGYSVIAFTKADCDITHIKRVRDIVDLLKPDIVFNAAAYTDVDGCMDNIDRSNNINSVGAKNFAFNITCTVVHFSTDFVFGEDGVYSDDDIPNVDSRINMYGIHKAQVEDCFERNRYSNYFVIRVGSIYGKYGKNFASTLSTRLLNDPYIKVDASRLVAPTYVRDVVRCAAVLGHTKNYGSYNCSAEGQTTWARFAETMAEKLSQCCMNIIPVADMQYKARRPKNVQLINQKLIDLGLDQPYHWTFGLDAFIKEIQRG